RQELLVVCLRALEDAAVLRRLAQGHLLHADRVQGREEREGVLLHLQAQRPQADLRRQPQEARIMPALLCELLSEEGPARRRARSADDLKKMVTDRLVAAGLVYKGAKAFATPRRLPVSVRGGPGRH